jgi:hypothetical protein
MPPMRAWMVVLLISATACSGGFGGSCSIGPGEPASAPATDVSTVPHGDHSPHHGGVVMMNGDLHYEAVFDRAGRYSLYFTDATRVDLPATTAARASVTVMRPDAPPEGVSLQIDESGESWVGTGQPVKDPGATKVRVAYTLRGAEPYWIDLPFVPPQADSNAPDPHKR